MMKTRTTALLAAALALTTLAGSALAQNPGAQNPRAQNPGAQNDGRTLRVTMSKAEVLTLNGTASVVMVANPQIADVVLERNNLLFILGKQPGETRLYVYNGSGKPMLERDVVVVPQGDRTVTIMRDGQPNEYSCAPRCVSLERRVAAPAAAPAAPAAAQ